MQNILAVYFIYYKFTIRLVAHMVRCLPTVLETWVWSLGWEDTLEKEMAIHSNTLPWKIPWMKEPGGLQSVGLQRVRHDRGTSLVHYYKIYLKKKRKRKNFKKRFIYSNSFLIKPLDFSIYNIMQSVNSDRFTSYFPA